MTVLFSVRDARNHKLVRGEPFNCGKHDHLIYTCPMRVGNRICGQQVVVPPMGGDCGEDKS